LRGFHSLGGVDLGLFESLGRPSQRAPNKTGHYKKAKYSVNSPAPGVERMSAFLCGPG